ncbi:MAG: hypothetical protein JO112_17950 [Planctomycetes bacterium]|nr:hypothetical protein [Planctomycetota bacterium]
MIKPIYKILFTLPGGWVFGVRRFIAAFGGRPSIHELALPRTPKAAMNRRTPKNLGKAF